MIEGLWSVTFNTPFGTGGAGVVVCETGRVLGGDAGFIYVGDYKVSPTGAFNANVRVTKFLPDNVGPPSVFVPEGRDFNLQLSAPNIDPKGTTARGAVAGAPSLQITVSLVKRAELP